MPVYKDETRGSFYVKTYYTDYTGTKKQKLKRGFSLQREAKEWERAFLLKQAGSPSMSFSSLCELYLDDIKANGKAISYSSRKNRIDHWILPYFNKAVDQITPADIRKWETEIKDKPNAKGQPCSSAYMRNIFNECSCIFNYAVKYYKLPNNPCRIAGNFIGKKSKSINFWTHEQFKKFIDTFESNDPYKTFFELLYYTGLRRGEALALTPADITKSSIIVSKTLHRTHGQDIITSPKTAKSARTVAIHETLAAALNKQCSRIYGIRQHDRIFLFSASAIDAHLKKHTAAASLPKIRVHDFRHSHASLLIEMGFSPLLIADRLGHESVSTTLDIYAHLFPSKQSEVAEQIEQFFKPSVIQE